MFHAKSVIATLGLSLLILGPLAPAAQFFGADTAYAKNGNGGGNGGGKGNGKSGGKADHKGGAATHKSSKSLTKAAKPVKVATVAKGKLASELKGMNAVKANPNALANASPNSQVGRIASYRDAALAAQAAGEELTSAQEDLLNAESALDDAETALDALEENYTGKTAVEIDAEIAALDPGSDTYASDLEALSTEKTAAELHEADVAVKQAEVDAAAKSAAEAEISLADAEAFAGTATATEEAALSAATKGRVLSPEALAYVRDTLGLE